MALLDDVNEIKDKPVKATKKSDLVEIRIPRGMPGEDNFLLVGDNGKYYKLKRGETVKVPQSVVDIINESDDRREKALDYLDKLTSRKM